MFKAEVDLAVLVENLISKFTGVMAIKLLLLIVILLKNSIKKCRILKLLATVIRIHFTLYNSAVDSASSKKSVFRPFA